MAFDLDAVLREEDGEPFHFRFGGEDYSLPAHPDVRAGLAFDAGRAEEGLQLLLGPDQWARLKASPATLTEAGFVALMDAYQKHLGVGLGESQASTGS